VIGLSWGQSDTRAAQAEIAEREVAFYKIAFFIERRVYVQDMEWSSTVADSLNRFNEIKPIYFRCSNDRFSITSPRTRRNITITNPIFIRTNRANVN
jgi:hypothetical protein